MLESILFIARYKNEFSLYNRSISKVIINARDCLKSLELQSPRCLIIQTVISTTKQAIAIVSINKKKIMYSQKKKKR